MYGLTRNWVESEIPVYSISFSFNPGSLIMRILNINATMVVTVTCCYGNYNGSKYI